MKENEQLSTNKAEEQRDILNTLRKLLEMIGSANDAEDHGYVEDAARMRHESCETIRELLMEHGFLSELFPKLQWELDTGHILGFGWAELYHSVDEQLGNMGNVQG